MLKPSEPAGGGQPWVGSALCLAQLPWSVPVSMRRGVWAAHRSEGHPGRAGDQAVS